MGVTGAGDVGHDGGCV